MQTSNCASFKNNYIFQIPRISVNTLPRPYNLMIKIIPSALNIFTKKNKRYYVYLPIPYIQPSLSRVHQAVPIMNHYYYCLMASGTLRLNI